MSLFPIFAGVLLPTLATGAMGFLLGRVCDVDPEPLNTVTVCVLAPVLMFCSLATTGLAGEMLTVLTTDVVAYHVAMFLVASDIARLAGIFNPLLGALVLVAAFPNPGNYGTPASSLAFGDTDRSTTVACLAAQSVLIYMLGVRIAGRRDDHGDAPPEWCAGLEHTVRIPLVYTVVTALAVRRLGVVPPTDVPVMETLRLVGDSSIPMMLLILDIQPAGAGLGSTLSEISVVTTLKMAVAPAVAIGVVLVAGSGGPTIARTFVLEPAMPTVVTPLILIVELGDASEIRSAISFAELVSTTVFAVALLSMSTLSMLIYLLNHGFVV